MALPDTILAFKILEGLINDNQRQMAFILATDLSV